MQFIRGLHNIQPAHQHAIVTIGNFDGVHKGHQKILQKVAIKAKQQQLASLLITFEPQPAEFFLKHNAPARLTNFREKLMALRAMPIDYVLCMNFNQKFADLSANDFIQKILVEKLKVKTLVTGEDFQFGNNRQGNINLLKEAALKFDFSVVTLESIMNHDERISSTKIRDLLQKGELAQVQQLLGREYGMQGRVVYGDQRGRLLGFPTANIHIKRAVLPLTGVYAVKAQDEQGYIRFGVANIGKRPTVCGEQAKLEVHLFDYEGDLYHQRLQVNFIHKIRDEQRFASLDELKQQIALDEARARGLLGY